MWNPYDWFIVLLLGYAVLFGLYMFVRKHGNGDYG